LNIRPERIRTLRTTGPSNVGPVLLWLNRDRRLHDNWAMLHAQACAIDRKVPLHVVFCLVPQFLDATWRQYHVLVEGLKELATECLNHNIAFTLLEGDPAKEVPIFADALQPSLLVTDYDPLRAKRRWVDAVVHSTHTTIHQVDAHNIVPIWTASQKREFGAYTLRPKLNRLLPTFLEPFPQMVRHPFGTASISADWKGATNRLQVDRSQGLADWLVPGQRAANNALRQFIDRMAMYNDMRNNPVADAQSGLSPWLHFGQISAQRVALDVAEAAALDSALRASADAFLEELIVRRELADNFVEYNPHYDSVEGFPAWAQATLHEHRDDRRDYVYDMDTWERAATHDPLWNAAQHQLLATGKMHGYMRMYWAKKILEWTPRPEDAMAIAIYLNDKYELDGRDSNGYAGVAWSIGGVHDRAWFERPVYGKIRYMNSNGAAKKFDVPSYIATWTPS
jgi:deoxyribodipyrimidine photo-lyase